MADNEDEPLDESWMATYADAITLLMAFFVMLLNFSKIDIPAFEEAAAGIANEIGMGPKEASPISIMMVNIQDMVFNMQADEVVEVEKDDKGVVIELASSAFYKAGSAEIRDQAIPVLKEISDMLTDPKYATYIVEVEGHSDDDPIHTAMFPSNWELSSRRATRVVRFFIEGGMNPFRLKAASFAETRPKLPNRDAQGVPIPENQAENRRVLVRVYPMSQEESAKVRREVTIDDIREEAKTAEEGEAPPAQSQ